jgi:hypothetical protein
MMWEKLDDNAKKMLATRMLDERILKKEQKIKLLEHKVETLKTMKTWIEKDASAAYTAHLPQCSFESAGYTSPFHLASCLSRRNRRDQSGTLNAP